jgi:hypothetical protein
MRTALLRASIFAAVSVAAACTAGAGSSSSPASDEAITQVPQTPRIKNQAIGNCWIYATGSWVESMHKTAANEDFNTSESYWTYIDWFQKITAGGVGSSISEGGSFGDSSSIIQRYGLVAEKDFIAADVNGETSSAQGAAETAINASLKSGPLSDPNAQTNPTIVRQELDKAFGITADASAMITKVFGADLSKTFADGTADATGTAIIPPTSFSVAYTSGPGTPAQTKTLLDATNDWQTVSYDPGDHRHFEERFQRALHDEQPVVMSWFVDFNYLDNDGRFILDPQHLKTPGSGGGHMVVMEDYQIDNVPGFGTLKAGTPVTDPKALNAALDDSATIEFIRIKNSWGTSPPDVATMPGYYDLYTNYLETRITECGEDTSLPDGGVDTTKCNRGIPFEDVTLPPGY